MERLQKEKKNLKAEIARANGKLNNEKFVSKAPAEVVAAEREKLDKYSEMYSKVLERIELMKNKM